MLRQLFILVVLTGCALTPTQKVKKELKQNDISAESIAMLSKTSYIKGCIDGMNEIKKEKTKGRRHQVCVKKSMGHYQEILQLIKEE